MLVQAIAQLFIFQKEREAIKSLDERIMLIDICHDSESDNTNIINYYKNNFRNSDGTVKHIFRFISTHPHQDHICGLNNL